MIYVNDKERSNFKTKKFILKSFKIQETSLSKYLMFHFGRRRYEITADILDSTTNFKTQNFNYCNNYFQHSDKIEEPIKKRYLVSIIS